MDNEDKSPRKFKSNGVRRPGFVNKNYDTEDVDTGQGQSNGNNDDVGSFTSLDLSSDTLEAGAVGDRNANTSITSKPVLDAQFTISDKENKDEPPKNESDSASNIVSMSIVKSREIVSNYLTKNAHIVKVLWIGVPLAIVHAYLIYALVHNIENKLPFDCCNGLGFLFILYGLGLWAFVYYFVLKRMLGRRIRNSIIKPVRKQVKEIWSYRFTSLGLVILATIALVTFLALDTVGQRRRLVSAGGIFVIVFIGLLFSKNPQRIRWRHVIWALSLQFLFGLLVLRWDGGNSVLNCLSDKVKAFLEFTFTGTDFLYGYLSTGQPSEGLSFRPIFVFRALCVIYFFGFVISMLYHYGVMQWVIVKLGWLLQVTIGTTAAESMSAAANIFVGQVEAPLLIKPFLNDLTNSELNAVMTAGFATIAGTVMAAYISLGISASYLLSASVMAAPAALGIAKLIYPEAKESKTTSKEIKLLKTESSTNAIDAAAQGAMQGTILIGCIIANVIAFVSFVAFLNAIVSWLGNLVGVADLTFEKILGWCFIPVAFILGVDPEEVDKVGRLLGLKLVANEFIAYEQLKSLKISPRTEAITTFALCSFANAGSLGIQLGGLGALLSPERRGDLAKAIGRAFFGGVLVGFLNACVAGCLLPSMGYADWTAMNLAMNMTNATNVTTTIAPILQTPAM